MTGLTLAQKVLAIEGAVGGVPHAFGGALALAYYAEPRATVDIDLNVFVGPDAFDQVALPLQALGVAAPGPAVVDQVRRDGQTRLMWETTPLDLFLAYDPFHEAAARGRRVVPFGEASITILGPEHLVVCKAVFNRNKDWVDIDALVGDGTSLDPAEVVRWVGRIAGDDDPRYRRVVAVLTGS